MKKIVFLISLLALFLVSCTKDDLTANFDNVNDPDTPLYIPDTPRDLKIEDLNGAGAKISWVYQFSRSSTDVYYAHKINFDFQIKGNNEENYRKISFASEPVVVYSTNNLLMLQANINYNFAINNSYNFLIRAEREGKMSPYSNLYSGNISLLPPKALVVTYDPITKKLFLAFNDYWSLHSGNKFTGWNIREGYFLYVRKYNSNEEFRQINNVANPLHDSYQLLEFTDLSGYTHGTQYEFAIAAYFGQSISAMTKTVWSY
jgi:hypothetical protein